MCWICAAVSPLADGQIGIPHTAVSSRPRINSANYDSSQSIDLVSVRLADNSRSLQVAEARLRCAVYRLLAVDTGVAPR